MEAAQMRVVLRGDQGGHVQGAAQMFVARLADARGLVDAAAGGAMASGPTTPRLPAQLGGQFGAMRVV